LRCWSGCCGRGSPDCRKRTRADSRALDRKPAMEHYLNLAVRSIFLENMALAYFLGM
jgi:hypothetical protein